ncbi:integrase core domain-containing protein [Bradyrhizobium sp.]|jgi:transposase InsO family protein|uniref:integrase core domain-containing protein n=1 Tax=Bradyrhizobium sp. TaxID=376 RepID=UPI003C6F2E79
MFVEYDSGNWSVSELCRRYGICRDTFYEWRGRRETGDPAWFVERSHAPKQCWQTTDADIAKKVIAARRRFPYMGPRKLLRVLESKAAGIAWPAASTIGDILKRAGLVEPVKRRRRALDQGRPCTAVTGPNDEWSTDFKGWFRTLDQQRIDPLTVVDSHSRFLIEVRIVAPTTEGVRPCFERAFREYGLPRAIRCDNGSPFGSRGAAGLTKLSVWWTKLGIAPHFIHPASPQENGRHERMHRTLKKQTSAPPARNARDQQARFDNFRRHYNEERPHEALGQQPPAQAYTASLRAMPERAKDPWYDADHRVRRVRGSGEVKWKGEFVFIGEALVNELVGIAELETGDHVVRFCDLDVGLINRNGMFTRFAPPREGLREPGEHPA